MSLSTVSAGVRSAGTRVIDCAAFTAARTCAFDATDPSAPEQKSKERPALVVAASPDGLLVRPVYSSISPSRHVLQAWRRLGLDHVCYLDDTRVALSVAPSESLERVGRLTDLEWNAQL